MTKSKVYWAIGAVALAGVSYAVLQDPQPTTYNGLVRVPTGVSEVDSKNAIEDAKNAYRLHEEARMNGDFDKALFYEEAAEAALSIGRKAILTRIAEFDAPADGSTGDSTVSGEASGTEAAQPVLDLPRSGPVTDPAILEGMRRNVETMEFACQQYGSACAEAEALRREYDGMR